MEYQKLADNLYIVRFAHGERLMEVMRLFCQKFEIRGGYIAGIGAVDEAELAHYSVADKEYTSVQLAQPLEVTSVNGNFGVGPDGLIIHVHGTFADEQMRGFGGHIVEMRVSGTLELFMTLAGGLRKGFEEETGLKVFELCEAI